MNQVPFCRNLMRKSNMGRVDPLEANLLTACDYTGRRTKVRGCACYHRLAGLVALEPTR